MDKICKYFEKDFDFFIDPTNQINNIEKPEGSINNYGTINLSPENIIEYMKKVFEENQQKDSFIKTLQEENKILRSK